MCVCVGGGEGGRKAREGEERKAREGEIGRKRRKEHVYTLPANSIYLAHEIGVNAMEYRALVAISFLVSAETTEVLCTRKNSRR